MALLSSDLRQAVVLVPANRLAASNKASAVIDTMPGGVKAQQCIFTFLRDNSGASSIRFRVRHCSASATLFASATDFTTVCSHVMASTATNAGRMVDLQGAKRYLRIKMSGVSNTAVTAVIASFFGNGQQPAGATLATASAQGFASLTVGA